MIHSVTTALIEAKVVEVDREVVVEEKAEAIGEEEI